MKIRPYTHRPDRELAQILLGLMTDQGLTEPPSISRTIQMLKAHLRTEHGDELPDLGTGRAVRVVDAWLPVVRAQQEGLAADQRGDSEALEAARQAETVAMERAVRRTEEQLVAERVRSEARRRAAKIQAEGTGQLLRSQVRDLLIEAYMAGLSPQPGTPRNPTHDLDPLMQKFDAFMAAEALAPKPSTYGTRKIPVDQNLTEPEQITAPVDQNNQIIPVDQLTIYNDPRQVSLLADQNTPT